jgi:hypothetical protein
MQDILFPFVPVSTQSGQYRVFAKKNELSIPDVERGPSDEAKSANYAISLSEYNCADKAQKFFISDNEMRNQQNQANGQGSLDMEEETTTVLMSKLMLARESRCETLAFTSANYPAANKTQLVAATQWDNHSSVDSIPIDIIWTAYQACHKKPNTVFMGLDVFIQLTSHPQILERITGGAYPGSPAMVTPQLLAQIFRVNNVYVCEAMYDSTPKTKTTFTKGYIWTKHCVVAYINPSPSTMDNSAFKTFRFTPEGGQDGIRVRVYRDEARGGGGVWVEVDQSVDEAIIDSSAAYMIEDAIS